MITSIAQLKEWFENFKTPTQDHFHNLIDSFFHKDELLPIAAVDGLQDAIDNAGGGYFVAITDEHDLLLDSFKMEDGLTGNIYEVLAVFEGENTFNDPINIKVALDGSDYNFEFAVENGVINANISLLIFKKPNGWYVKLSVISNDTINKSFVFPLHYFSTVGPNFILEIEVSQDWISPKVLHSHIKQLA